MLTDHLNNEALEAEGTLTMSIATHLHVCMYTVRYFKTSL